MRLWNDAFQKRWLEENPLEGVEDFSSSFFVQEDRANEFFQNYYGFPLIDLYDRELRVFPLGKHTIWCTENICLPLEKVDQKILVFSSPPDEELIKDARSRFGEERRIFLAPENEILELLYDRAFPMHRGKLESREENGLFDLSSEANLKESIDQPIQALIRSAFMHGISDLHFIPEEAGCRVRPRKDGILEDGFLMRNELYTPILNKLKLLGHLDLAEKRRPQEGHISLLLDEGRGDLRLATMDTSHGEKMVLRLLPAWSRRELEKLGFSSEKEKQLRGLIARRQGLLLITGPTNSGKTTTAYSLLEALREEGLAIYTVEDPIEIRMTGLNQIQINRKNNFDFSLALRGILRQDPDIIFIGEIRDEESAHIAVRAALTGHLVIASLHVSNAHLSIERLRDLGLSNSLIASSLIGVVNQRLLAQNCPVCQRMTDSLCRNCRGLGIRGRIGIQEVWVVDQEDREWIQTGSYGFEVRNQCIKKGFKSLWQDAVEKENQGLIDRSLERNRWFVEEFGHGDL